MPLVFWRLLWIRDQGTSLLHLLLDGSLDDDGGERRTDCPSLETGQLDVTASSVFICQGVSGNLITSSTYSCIQNAESIWGQ